MAAHGQTSAAWAAPADPTWPVHVAPPDSGADMVAGIVDCAEDAVEAIASRAEHEIAQIAAEVDARVLRGGVERRLRLESLRHELAARATALAAAQSEVADLLAAVDTQLGWSTAPAAPAPQPEPADARVAAIKMTLRERQRIHMPAPAAPAPLEAIPAQPLPPHETVVLPSPEAVVSALPVAQYERRRWWRPWQRAAA